jgi:hypothetical protein
MTSYERWHIIGEFPHQGLVRTGGRDVIAIAVRHKNTDELKELIAAANEGLDVRAAVDHNAAKDCEDDQ